MVTDDFKAHFWKTALEAKNALRVENAGMFNELADKYPTVIEYGLRHETGEMTLHGAITMLKFIYGIEHALTQFEASSPKFHEAKYLQVIRDLVELGDFAALYFMRDTIANSRGG